MIFIKSEINKLKPVQKNRRQTIKNESLMVEQRLDSVLFYYRFRSPTNSKMRIKKLASFNYGSVSAKDIQNIKDEVTTLKALVISGQDPLDTKKQEMKQRNYRSEVE